MRRGHTRSTNPPYRCWAAWADVPRILPITFQKISAARNLTITSTTWRSLQEVLLDRTLVGFIGNVTVSGSSSAG